MQGALGNDSRHESITPLLNRLVHFGGITDPIHPDEIAKALNLLLDDKLSDSQSAALLSLLHHKKKDRKDREVAIIGETLRCIIQLKIDVANLQQVISTRGKPEGNYLGGLCELAGTGGNATPTIASVAATASFIASPFLLVSQHGHMGANSPTPSVGNDLILASIKPVPPALNNITPKNVAEVLEENNYAFLPEPNFYPAMAHINSIRQGLGIRTIFDLLSTLVHPIQGHIEARMIGVSNPDLGPALAQVL
ncbi:anthranilate phosphoribosyltransferase [Aspergillus hancockii]|nr:anthranilate phosphoribosyltransferase [Aspergillus hancockii]